MPQALLALGSNLGDARDNVEGATNALRRTPGLSLVASSSLHTTQPVGGPAGQGEFANAVVTIETDASPIDLLDTIQGIEQMLGRQRTKRWAARTLDLDLLLYDDQVIRLPTLAVPHPRMSFRPFVLDPAIEIAGDWCHPLLDASLGELHLRLHHGDDAVVIYGGSEADRGWHAEWLCERFSDFAVANGAKHETVLALSSAASHERPRLAIQLQSVDKRPRPGMPTLSIPASGRADVVFDTEAAILAVWPDLCRGGVGE